MNELTIRPETAYRHTMYIVWFIISLLVGASMAGFVFLIREEPEAVVFVTVLSSIFAVIMLLYAIWIPLYVATLEYVIGAKSVRMKGGVLWKRQVTVPFGKVTNVDISQGPIQRIFGIGTVHVQTAGAGGAEGGRAELRIAGIREFESAKDTVLMLMESGGSVDVSSKTASHIPVAGSNDQTMLAGILNELRAIRELLSKS